MGKCPNQSECKKARIQNGKCIDYDSKNDWCERILFSEGHQIGTAGIPDNFYDQCS